MGKTLIQGSRKKKEKKKKKKKKDFYCPFVFVFGGGGAASLLNLHCHNKRNLISVVSLQFKLMVIRKTRCQKTMQTINRQHFTCLLIHIALYTIHQVLKQFLSNAQDNNCVNVSKIISYRNSISILKPLQKTIVLLFSLVQLTVHLIQIKKKPMLLRSSVMKQTQLNYKAALQETKYCIYLYLALFILISSQFSVDSSQ